MAAAEGRQDRSLTEARAARAAAEAAAARSECGRLLDGKACRVSATLSLAACQDRGMIALWEGI